MGKNIGFVSFRISGTDGVSLETKKWADVFGKHDYTSHYFAGELDTPKEVSYIAEEAHFKHPKIVEMYNKSFDRSVRSRELTNDIHEYREILKKKLYDFIQTRQIDLLIPQNTLTIPLNVPLALALTELIAETEIPTIAHHHDFFWERKRFLNNCVWDYFNAAYPPHLKSVEHVVINSSAQNQLALRTGIGATLIPNVMDFEKSAAGIDDYNKDARKDIGVGEDELFILQPTRVVQRKGIEHAIELVARLGKKATLVISHASGDEGYEYQTRVKEFAELLGINAIFVSDIIDDCRATTEDGRKVYTLHDIYPHADLVTYPSLVEGFGNAFLEAIYHRKPIMVNNYSIYSYDIKPKGFDVIEMDNFISNETVEYTKSVLEDHRRIKQMAETNYRLALKYYSYSVLETKLRHLTTTIWGSKQFRDL
jgi:mannosylglucosylglycerate synthase